MMIDQIARILANLTLTLDNSGDTIDSDDIVKIQEYMASDMQALDSGSRKMLSDAFRRIAPEYHEDFRAAVASMPEDFGLEGEDLD
jgi:enamine deaminase RidA (YjgF/YER057c/UK114 family)